MILALVSDEEAGGTNGAKFLVDNHPELFDGARNAIGEFGGFSFDIGRRRFYAIMAAEKQACWLRLTVHGRSGHGSLSAGPGAMTRLSQVLERLERRRLPVHVTPIVRGMVETIAQNVPLPASLVFRLMYRPALTGAVLRLMGERGSTFAPLFRNTVTPTMVRGGQQINVTPGEIALDLDGRLLPGYGPDALVSEVRDALGETAGDGAEIEVMRWETGPPEADLDFFPALERVIREMDPEGIPRTNTAARSYGCQAFRPSGNTDLRFSADEAAPGVQLLAAGPRAGRAHPGGGTALRRRSHLPADAE